MKTFKNATLKNTFWLIGEKIFNMSINLITVSLLARYLGPENYGSYNYAIALVAMFTVISTMGIDTISIKSIVQKEEKEGTILFSSLVLRGVGGTLLIFISTIMILILAPDDKVLLIMVLIISISYMAKSIEIIEYWVQAYQQSGLSSTVRMIVTVIVALVKIGFVILELDLIYLAIIFLIESCLISIGFIYIYRRYRQDHSKWKFSWNYVKLTLAQSWYMIVSGLMIAAYTSFDKVLVANLSSTSEVGLLTAAQSISNLWVFIPMALVTSFKPVIMKKKMENEQSYYQSIQQLFSFVAVLSISFSLIVFIFSDLIISILYGPEYKGAGPILTFSVWAGCFAILGSIRGIWMAVERLQKYSIFYLGIGAIVSVSLNLVLIPQLGAVGAGISLLVTEVTTGILAPLLFKETRVMGIMAFKGFLFKELNIRKFLKQKL